MLCRERRALKKEKFRAKLPFCIFFRPLLGEQRKVENWCFDSIESRLDGLLSSSWWRRCYLPVGREMWRHLSFFQYTNIIPRWTGYIWLCSFFVERKLLFIFLWWWQKKRRQGRHKVVSSCSMIFFLGHLCFKKRRREKELEYKLVSLLVSKNFWWENRGKMKVWRNIFFSEEANGM